MRRRISRRCDRLLPRLLIAAALLVSGSAVPADDSTASLDAALKQAQARHAPVLVDFYAPWCYSCYYMAKTVKNGPEWQRLENRAVVLELDADAPDGAHWLKAWSVKGLPNYVVLDESGRELGRIQLERTRAQFYPEIDAIIARGTTLESLQARVRDGSAASVKAATAVLQAFHARGQFDEGLAWRGAQPPAVSAALDRDASAKLWRARLELMKAAKAGDIAQCSAIAPRVLAGELGCDRAYELDRVLECTASLSASDQGRLIGAEKARMRKLLATRVFVRTPSCADARSVVSTAADLSKALGDASGEAKILDRAIDDAVDRLGGPERLDLRKDRNLADNLRAYLDRAGRIEALDSLHAQLIKAYPDDYVYAYRFGKSLAERGEFAKALPYFEQAAPKAYGVNRLNVAQWRAETLIRLGRAGDAKQVVADALKANGPFFPELTDKLRAIVAKT
ncbi:MAG: hypothetical protein NVS9B10_10860 [Nevskia sp.]